MKQTNSSYKFHVARLSSTPIPQLIEYFNKEVGTLTWTSERAAFDTALIDALINKGIDVLAVYDGSSISFKREVSLNSESKILIALA
jgi:hypothetical protein